MKKISAITLTYGRASRQKELLEECLYWYTAQDYENKELIILNDCPGETLICSTPGVKIYNFPSKIPTLGEKYDEAIKLSSGDIILGMEDDDISLPNRMSQAAKALENYEYFNPQKTFYEQGGKIHTDHSHGVCHNASAFTKEAWAKVGGYGKATGNQDLVMDRRLKSQVKTLSGVSSIEDWSYVYRWGVSTLHLSGQKDMQKAYNNYNFSGEGNIFINPTMRKNYKEIVNKIIITQEIKNN